MSVFDPATGTEDSIGTTLPAVTGTTPASGTTGRAEVTTDVENVEVTIEQQVTNLWQQVQTLQATVTNQSAEIAELEALTSADPINLGLPVISPSNPMVGTPVVVSNGSWSGTPTLYTYLWNGSAGVLTNSTYSPVTSDIGNTLVCTVTASNGTGSGQAASAPTAAVVAASTAAPPTNSVVPVISGTAMVGDLLTVSNGVWSGSPTPVFTYQWKSGSVNASGTGAQTNSYLVASADLGNTITCVVTATNAMGHPSVTTSATAAVTATSFDAINVAYAGLNGTNGVSNIAVLEGITGVTYNYAHVYCDADSTWAAFAGPQFFVQESGNRFDQWVAAVPGRNLLVSTGMIPSAQSDPISITTLGALAGTGTGTFVVASYGANWPTTGSFQMEVFDTVNELITVTAHSGGGTTMTCTARAVAGSTAVAHNTGKTCDYDWRVPAAAGSFNTYWSAFGAALVAAGLPACILRIGHECNGPYERHWIGYLQSQQANWALYFQQIVTTLRAVAGANFTFEWNMNAGYLGETLTNFYPGDAFVDYVGIDQYDSTINTYSGAAGGQWAVQLNGQGSCGLGSILAFAVAHNKPMAYSEWGLTVAGTQGFGDDPAYINNMATLFQGQPPPSWAGGTVPPCHHQSLFNPLAPSGSTTPVPSTNTGAIEFFTNSLAAYIADFVGGSVGTGPTLVTPATITGSPEIGSVLSAVGYWTGATSFTYQWFLNGSSIGGAVFSSYTPTAVGTYTCTVTGIDASGSTPSTTPGVYVSGGSVAVALAQSAIAETSTSTAVMVSLTDVQAGDLLTLVGCEFNAIAVTAMSGGGTWVKAQGVALTSGGSGTVEMWYCLSATGGNTTVTITLASAPAAGRGTYMVTEWVGADWSFDQTASSVNAASSTTPTSPSITPANAGELIIVAGAFQGKATAVSTGWARINTTYTNTDLSEYGDAAYIVDSGSSAIQCTWTQSADNHYTSAVMAFIPTVTDPVNVTLPVITDTTSGTSVISAGDVLSVSNGTWE